MKKNKNRLNRTSLLIFAFGVILSVISMFLPWYFYTVALNGIEEGLIFYPFEGWFDLTQNQSNTLLLPDLSSITIFFYLDTLYGAIILPIVILNLSGKTYDDRVNFKNFENCENSENSENLKDNWIQILIYLGPILSTIMLFQFFSELISINFYIPYLEILMSDDNNSQIRIYSLSIGVIINFCALIMKIYGACMIENSTFFGLNDYTKEGYEKWLNHHLKNNPTTKFRVGARIETKFRGKSKIDTPLNEFQRVEDQYTTLYSKKLGGKL